ncbi:MAG TPA: hypothetical protein VL742_12075 [Casimicrobiaceae bacterium]|nr:hypothetical protein [Casimicrobiaceae bacterium]
MKAISYAGWVFSYPQPLFLSPAPSGPGLYAVQVADPSYKPHPFEPIFFGESEDLADRSFPSQEAFRRWCQHPAVISGSLLYISYLRLPYNRRFRQRVEGNLVARYRPACNVTFADYSRGFLGA